MHYEDLIPGTLTKRYKRFLADVSLEGKGEVTVHCPNSGSMKSCSEPGSEVYVSPVKDPKRKTRFTWEMIRVGETWVGINTQIPNKLAYDWISKGIIPGFGKYNEFRREVTWEDSRFDIMAQSEEEICFIEVKNVTLRVGDQAQFPDAVTSRGKKHLETLVRAKKEGYRSVMLYMVQRMDVKTFAPAKDIDPEFAEALEKALKAGVEVLAVQARVTPDQIEYAGMIDKA